MNVCCEWPSMEVEVGVPTLSGGLEEPLPVQPVSGDPVTV